MSFIARAWHVLVTIKDALVLIFMLLFFGALYALLSSSPNPAKSRDGALVLALNGSIVEQKQALDPREFLTGTVAANGQYLLRDVVHVLETAAKDDDVKTVVLDLDGFSGGGQAALSRVGEALSAVRKANKPIYAFATGYSDDSYQLAAHASEIWLDPMGAALFTGPGGAQPYFKGLIDKIGITANVYRVGKFKSFIEPYVRADQSPEAKQAAQALTGALWANWQDEVGKARPKAKLAAMIADPAGLTAASGGDMSKTALANGIVDKLGDYTSFAKRVATLVGADSDTRADDFNATEFDDYLAANPPSMRGSAIGIATIAGEIVDGNAPSGVAGGDTIANLILDAVADEDLKALVVRVDSPGGSALASEKIRLAILQAKAKGLPVVVSMGNVAASGGYWVSMAGDVVFADPSTITGSIGVFGIIPTFEKVIPKVGISADGVTTTPLSGQPDVLRGTNETTDRLIQSGIEDIYRRFTSLVAANRKMTVARVDEIGQGRVWDGGTARQIGLVDRFGSLDDAIAEAAKRAKIEPDSVQRLYLEPEPSFLSGLLSGMVHAQAPVDRTDIFTRLIRQQQAYVTTGFHDATRIISGPAVQVRCMECPASAPTQNWQSFYSFLSAKVFS
ncbi:MAG: signal peptide peptidase SppA [Chakrabartia sp.]